MPDHYEGKHLLVSPLPENLPPEDRLDVMGAMQALLVTYHRATGGRSLIEDFNAMGEIDNLLEGDDDLSDSAAEDPDILDKIKMEYLSLPVEQQRRLVGTDDRMIEAVWSTFGDEMYDWYSDASEVVRSAHVGR